MFFKKNIFFVILIYFIHATNFKNCYCMESEQHGLKDESATSNGNSIGTISDIDTIENVCQSYLINQEGEIPDFPKKFKNKSITPIHTAAYFNSVNWLKAVCINKNKEERVRFLSVFDDKRNSPMNFAARQFSLDAARFLLDNNSSILLNRFDENPILVVLKYANSNHENSTELCLEFIKLIVSRCDSDYKSFLLNTCDLVGASPLCHATEKWDIEVIKWLLENGAYVDGGADESDFNDIPGIKAKSPLHVAIKRGDKDIVKLLLKFGANYADREKNKTALQLAEKLGKGEIAHIIWKKMIEDGRVWIYEEEEYDEADSCRII